MYNKMYIGTHKVFFLLQFVAERKKGKKTRDVQSEFWSIPVSIANNKRKQQRRKIKKTSFSFVRVNRENILELNSDIKSKSKSKSNSF